MEASGSKRKTKQTKVSVKRKLDCCDGNAEWRMKIKTKCRIQCDYCQCLFYETKKRDAHMKIHECSQCHDIAIGDDARAHKIQHQQEVQLEALQKQRQRQMDDDFVLCYVRANRLHQYRPQLHYEPDFDFIVFNYRFGKDEWLAFVKKFKRRFLDLFFGSFKDNSNYAVRYQHVNLIKQLNSNRKARSQHDYLNEQVNSQVFAYLLENKVLSICDAIDFLNILMKTVGYDDYVSVIVSYLFDNGCKIKAEWVARAIRDDELIERIKSKNTFSFDEIHKARKWNTNSAFDINGLKMFYSQLQKHFFNPNFENPFDDLHDETDRVRNQETVRYLYDKERDKLLEIVDNGKRYWNRGSFAKMMNKSLSDLIQEYIKEIKVYDDFVDELNRLIAERDRNLDECENQSDRDHAENYYSREIDGNARHELVEQGYVLSHLYFAISLK